jgi:DNA-binding response OmpR family regulator
LLNLAINAKDAMPQGGSLTIETGVVDFGRPLDVPGGTLEPGEYVRIAVTDTGHGIPEDVLPKIFEPFFTTKPAGRGTGLGLSMVFGTVQSLSGGIRVDTTPDVGTTFELLLPATPASREVDRALTTEEYARISPGECTVLVVEDDRLVAQTVEQQLVDHGHQVLLASSVEDAEAIATEHADAIDVALTDSVLHDGFGTDVARRISSVLPDVGIIFMSAHGQDTLLAQERVLRGGEFLQKPFDDTQLQRALTRVIGRARLRGERGSKILVVEDHATLLTALVAVLESEGYEIIQAKSVSEALEQPLDGVGLLITDISLPDGTGPELARRVAETVPAVDVIHCSGFSREVAAREFDLPPESHFVRKPFNFDEFLGLVDSLLRPANAEQPRD